MKIAIMGTGGVGGYFGGLLAKAGNDVTFIARGEHLKSIQAHGLRIMSSNDGNFTVHSKAIDSCTGYALQDLILFTVKMYHNKSAIETIKPLVGNNTVILTLQNGITNADQLIEEFGEAKVMIGSAYLEGRIQVPGGISLGGPGTAAFGELTIGSTERTDTLLTVFTKADWRVTLEENMQGMLWKKFAYLAGSAAVCTASGSNYGEMRILPSTRETIRCAIQEVLEVGKARGAAIMEDSLDWAMNALDNFPATGLASMTKDFHSGGPVELEGLTGAVLEMGHELNVPVPVNETLYGILKPWEVRLNNS